MNPEKIFEDNDKDEYFERVAGDSDYQIAEKLWKEDLERMEQEKESVIEFNLEEEAPDTFIEKGKKEEEIATFKNKEKEGSEKLFIELKKKENEEKKETLGKDKKKLFDKLIHIAKDKKVQLIIGVAILGVSIAIPPVGGAAWLTGGMVSGFLPAQLGVTAKVLGGATGGALIGKILKVKKEEVQDENKSEIDREEAIVKELNELTEILEDLKAKIKEEVQDENNSDFDREEGVVKKGNESAGALKSFKTETKEDLEEREEIIFSRENESKEKEGDQEHKVLNKEKKAEEINEIFDEIESNIDKHPESVKEVIKKRDSFFKYELINGKEYVFTGNYDGKVLALVKSNDGIWKTRLFRFSGSDKQWKSYPGKREDGSIMKGEEDNTLHHYVQSAKLDKDMHVLLSQLPDGFISYGENYSQYIPHKERYREEFEFKEDYLELKDPQWEKYQKWTQAVYKIYMTYNKSNIDLSLDKSFYMFAKRNAELAPSGEIKECFEGVAEALENYKGRLSGEVNLNSEEYQKEESFRIFVGKYKENVSKLLDILIKCPCPKDMIPDFSKSNMVDAYVKEDIMIEEYEVKSQKGDNLIFAMAYDKEGRVYIDNIYDPRAGMNDYGVYDKICQMGYLVYKPEDYQDNTFGIPDEYKHEAGGYVNDYVDINDYFGKIPIIKKYREELIKRGVVLRSTILDNNKENDDDNKIIKNDDI